MILAILALGLFLRLVSINQSFWLDEATSAVVARDFSFGQIITSFSSNDFHPPFYYLLLHLWGKLFGVSEISMRFPSVLFGLGTVYLTYLIAKKLFNKNIAFWSAIFLAVAPLHIYYSQEARMYSQVTFFTTLAFYLYIQKKWLLFSLSLIACVFSDYLALFVLPGFLLFSKRNERNKIIKSFIPLIICFLIWSPIFLNQLEGGLKVNEQGSLWWKVLGQASLKQTLLVPLKFSIGRISFANKIFYALFSLGVLLIPFLAIVKGFINYKKTKILLFWLFLPVISSVLVSLKIPVLSYFRLLFCLPAFYILLSSELYSKKVLLQIFLVASFGCSCYYLLNYNFHREEWRGLINFVQEESSNKNSQVVFPADSQMEVFNYYKPKIEYGGPRSFNEESDTVWLVRYTADLFDPNDNTRSSIEKVGFSKKSEHSFNGVLIWKYENSN